MLAAGDRAQAGDRRTPTAGDSSNNENAQGPLWPQPAGVLLSATAAWWLNSTRYEGNGATTELLHADRRLTAAPLLTRLHLAKVDEVQELKVMNRAPGDHAPAARGPTAAMRLAAEIVREARKPIRGRHTGGWHMVVGGSGPQRDRNGLPVTVTGALQTSTAACFGPLAIQTFRRRGLWFGHSWPAR